MIGGVRFVGFLWFLYNAIVFADARATSYLVVPCYNEELRLPREKFTKFVSDPANSDVFITFVNDGSRDGTLQLIESMAAEHPQSIAVFNLPQNGGKAEAVRKGMLHVLHYRNLTTSDVVGFWDADLATPLETVPKFMDLFRERPHLEMVFGARVALLGREIHRKVDRHYLGRIFATLASIVLNLRIYDTQCGAKLFRATEDLHSALAEPFSTGWIFDVELIARFIKLRSGTDKPPCEDVIFEYPLEKWEDIAGSKLALASKVWALYGLATIWFTYFGPGPNALTVVATCLAMIISAIVYKLAGRLFR